MKAFSLRNEIALITGGGACLGKAIAQCMVEAGARVVIVGRREEELERTAAALGKRASFLQYDVTRVEKAPDLIHRIKKSVGTPTILVNNTGIRLKKPAIETTETELQSLLQT